MKGAAMAEQRDQLTTVAQLLQGRSLAVAESCTAGRLATAFASVTRASGWFRGGLVAYQPAVKRRLLSVSACPVVSEPAAREMAIGAAQLLDADVTIATTGVAGDEPDDGVPPGTVVIATNVGGDVRVVTRHYDGTALEVCERAARQAVLDLCHHLEDLPARAHREPEPMSASRRPRGTA
jgi:PncC family amidohydrolase